MQKTMHIAVSEHSDSEMGKNGKVQLWDAISDRLHQDLEKITDRKAAMAYMQKIVPEIQKGADSLALYMYQGEMTEFISHQIQYTVVKILAYLENIFFVG